MAELHREYIDNTSSSCNEVEKKKNKKKEKSSEEKLQSVQKKQYPIKKGKGGQI